MEIKEIIGLLEGFNIISEMDLDLDRHILLSEEVVRRGEAIFKIFLDDLVGDNVSLRLFAGIIQERIEYYKYF